MNKRTMRLQVCVLFNVVFFLLSRLFCCTVDGREDKIICYVSMILVCYVSMILELIGDQCRHCALIAKATVRTIGCGLVIKQKCEAGHVFSWASSPTITKRNGQAIYKINLAFASSLLLSGNNFYKINQFCSFMRTNAFQLVLFLTTRDCTSVQ